MSTRRSPNETAMVLSDQERSPRPEGSSPSQTIVIEDSVVNTVANIMHGEMVESSHVVSDVEDNESEVSIPGMS